ncbi:MAG: Unknown protein, partial [uncultured Sulfurovum sp.]
MKKRFIQFTIITPLLIVLLSFIY